MRRFTQPIQFKTVIEILFFAAIYFLFAKSGELLAFSLGVTPLWPATGFGVGLIILKGTRFSPAIFMGVLAASLSYPMNIPTSVLLALGNTLEAILSAVILKSVLNSQSIPYFQRTSIAVILSAIFPPILGSIYGVTCSYFGGLIPSGQIFHAVFTWWSGNVLGIMAITPFAISYFYKSRFHKNYLLSILLLSATAVASYGTICVNTQFSLVFLIIGCLFVLSLGSGVFEQQIGTIIVCGFLIYAAVNERGIFQEGIDSDHFLCLQLLLGIFLLTSLILNILRNTGKIGWPASALLICLSLTTAISSYIATNTEDETSIKFAYAIEKASKDLEQSMLIYDNALRSGAGLMDASENVSAKEWRIYVDSYGILKRFSGILGLGVIYPVEPEKLKSFLGAQEKGFTYKEINGPNAGTKYIITYIEPLSKNLNARGIDIGSEMSRASAASEARDLGQPVKTLGIQLVQDTKERKGFLYLLPFYKKEALLATVEQRRSAFKGFIYAPIIYEDFFQYAFRDLSNIAKVWVHEGTSLAKENLIFQNQTKKYPASFNTTSRILFGGKTLTLGWQLGSEYRFSGNRMVSWVNLIGTIFAGFVVSLIVGFQNLYRKAEEIAAEKTERLEISENRIKAINRELEQTIISRSQDLMKAFEELKHSESNFRELADSMPQIVWTSDRSGKVDYFNEQWYRFSGFNRNQSDTPQINIITHPDDRDRLRIAWEESLRLQEPFEIQLRLWDYHFKVYRWFLSRSVPVFSEAGELTKWFGTSTDIHDQKMLQNEQQKLSQLVELSLDCILLINSEGNLLYFNEAGRTLLALDRNTEISINDLFIQPGFFHRNIRSEIESRGKWEGEVGLMNLDGGYEVITLSNAFKISEEGGSEVIALVAHDISDIKAAEMEKNLFVAREQAAIEASRMKSEFLANMSHEIRTPINGIVGLTKILKKTVLNNEQEDLIKSLEASSKSLHTLINDILDISKIEAGKIDLELIQFSLNELMTQTSLTFQNEFLTKGIRLRLDLDPKLPAFVIGDFYRIQQVLTNLISNAYKFSTEGEILLTIYPVLEQEGRVILHFSVKDNGIGISSDVQARLFQPFVQGDMSMSRKYGGSGLGLSICKFLIEKMGGKIGLKSEPGKGSIFWFTINLGLADAPETYNQSKEISFTIPGARTLLVEDNQVNQFVMNHTLKELGSQITVAENGWEALEKLKNETFDLVMMDCQMPVMDGFEATRIFRADLTGPNKGVPIIAVTANATDQEKRKCLEAGMNDFLSKPVDQSELFKVLYRWIPGLINQSGQLTMDQNIHHELIQLFKKNGKSALDKINASINERDQKGLSFELHKLRSSCLTLNYAEAGRLAARAESLCEENNWEAVRIEIELLRAQLQEKLN